MSWFSIVHLDRGKATVKHNLHRWGTSTPSSTPWIGNVIPCQFTSHEFWKLWEEFADCHRKGYIKEIFIVTAWKIYRFWPWYVQYTSQMIQRSECPKLCWRQHYWRWWTPPRLVATVCSLWNGTGPMLAVAMYSRLIHCQNMVTCQLCVQP